MLGNLVPAPLVRIFAGRYLAGDSMRKALDTAAELLQERGLTTTLDLLSEDVHDAAQVERNFEIYEKLLEAIAADERFEDRRSRPTVSLKPSAFATDDQEAAFEPIHRLADIAKRHRIGITIDMEDHRWTTVTLRRSIELFEAGYDIGTVIQTRLHRTEEDLESIPAGMRVRVVIGIYPEPATLATTDKNIMKERLLAHAGRLLERGAKVELATHDESFLTRFVQEHAPTAPDRCEVQMLLGVPRTEIQRQLLSGELGCALPVRLYVPFAVSWSDATAYLRRRMSESPGVVFSVLRNLFRRET